MIGLSLTYHRYENAVPVVHVPVVTFSVEPTERLPEIFGVAAVRVRAAADATAVWLLCVAIASACAALGAISTIVARATAEASAAADARQGRRRECDDMNTPVKMRSIRPHAVRVSILPDDYVAGHDCLPSVCRSFA